MLVRRLGLILTPRVTIVPKDPQRNNESADEGPTSCTLNAEGQIVYDYAIVGTHKTIWTTGVGVGIANT